MTRQTAIEWLIDNSPERFKNALINTCSDIIEQAKEMEEKQLKVAMLYALDEDGHTGDWKIRFVDTYYEQMFKNKSI